jgi:hypothetical protein
VRTVAFEKSKGYPALEEMKAILDKTNKESPRKEDVAELCRMLEAYPSLWRIGGDMARQARLQLIEAKSSTPLVEESMRYGVEAICHNLGYDNAPEIERLLIEQVALCWLRLNVLEVEYTTIRNQRTLTIDQAHFLERRLNYAQRRYMRACETLARVRKIVRRTPALQINIAAAGGQQVNVAGDLERG